LKGIHQTEAYAFTEWINQSNRRNARQLLTSPGRSCGLHLEAQSCGNVVCIMRERLLGAATNELLLPHTLRLDGCPRRS